MRTMKLTNNIVLAVVIFLCAISACKPVEWDVEDGGGAVGAKLRWNWKGVERGRPDSMCIIYNRYRYSQLDSVSRGIFPIPSEMDTTLILGYGSYQFISFSKMDDVYEILNLDQFDTLVSASPSIVDLGLKTLKMEDMHWGDILLKLYDLTEPYDKNDAEGKPDADEIFFVKDAQALYVSFDEIHLGADSLMDVALEPRNITGNFNIDFSIEVSKDASIDTVKAFVAGVVGAVNPMYGIVRRDDLYCLDLNVSLRDSVETDYKKRYGCTVDGNVLGIFSRDDEALYVNTPGVLNIIVRAKSGRNVNHYWRSRNLSSYLKGMDIMSYSADYNYNGYLLAKDTFRLEIEKPFEIYPGDKGDSLFKWEKIDTIKIDDY